MTKRILVLAALMALIAFPVHAGDPPIFNEILYDPHPIQPPSVPNGDANGDGTRDGSEDEFVEILNPDVITVDLSGYTISDAFTVRHTFPQGTLVPPGCAIIVFGGGTPTGSFGNSIVQTASTGFLGLTNGGDTVELRTAANVLIAMFSYDGSITDESMTRNPDITGVFEGHTTAAGDANSVHSPGTKIDGSTFGGCDPVPTESGTWGMVKSIYR